MSVRPILLAALLAFPRIALASDDPGAPPQAGPASASQFALTPSSDGGRFAEPDQGLAAQSSDDADGFARSPDDQVKQTSCHGTTTTSVSAFTLGTSNWVRWVRPSRWTRLESLRYRPRRYYREPEEEYHSRRTTGFSQIHGGFFNPEGVQSNAPNFGIRAGASIEENVQLGVGVDWSYRSDRRSVLVSESPLPGGGTTRREVELARSSSHLVPIMGVLQISPGGGLPITPYAGIGGGYEFLVVSAQDFQTGQDFDATYGGWGWQLWAGVAFPLSPRARLTTEGFMNRGDLGRDVTDPSTGQTFRELVNVNGVGMRFGLAWGF